MESSMLIWKFKLVFLFALVMGNMGNGWNLLEDLEDDSISWWGVHFWPFRFSLWCVMLKAQLGSCQSNIKKKTAAHLPYTMWIHRCYTWQNWLKIIVFLYMLFLSSSTTSPYCCMLYYLRESSEFEGNIAKVARRGPWGCIRQPLLATKVKHGFRTRVAKDGYILEALRTEFDHAAHGATWLEQIHADGIAYRPVSVEVANIRSKHCYFWDCKRQKHMFFIVTCGWTAEIPEKSWLTTRPWLLVSTLWKPHKARQLPVSWLMWYITWYDMILQCNIQINGG